ncbi:MAG: rod shape-determining protein MreD [Acidaminococcales bacterium]|nr:rod shape-determining protein MreD [Acidaminococcales bacterium]
MNLLLNWPAAIIAVVALQTTFSHFLSVYGIRPDIPLAFAIFAGTAAGGTAGMTAGFFVGLFCDLLNIGFFGFNIFFLFFVGLCSGAMQKKVFKDNCLFPLFLSAGFNVAREAAWAAALFLCGYRLTDTSALLSAAFGRIAYNILLALPLFFLFGRIRRLVKR